VVVDKSISLIGGHLWKGVVFTSEISVELCEGRGYKSLNFESLSGGNASSEREVSEVSSNSDSCGVDHFVLIGWKCWAVELGIVHGGDVLVSLGVAVILRYEFIEKWCKSVVRIVRSCINTNTGVSPL